MKNSPMIRINCRFLIMESSQDLVLGWEAIKRFNLMHRAMCCLNQITTKVGACQSQLAQ